MNQENDEQEFFSNSDENQEKDVYYLFFKIDMFSFIL